MSFHAQALRHFFAGKVGVIYEQWIALLQQVDMEIVYKPAVQMIVADALSRCHPHSALGTSDFSLTNGDPYFPYVKETYQPWCYPRVTH